ncbi:ArsR/SmtB family transcription factor [Demequina pelophila]|uniref:ArsR/SmtB family transcription factor n=1 Tax=Demequina pelophila TaxID=1638984 RepID=UPI0007840D8A|nr:metalloregulator ArsR/SmtB family transcription factor [Demequina pelophila]
MTTDDIFGALAHPARRAMLEWLVPGPTHAGDLGASAMANFGISASRASQHLRVLTDAGLIDYRPDGTWRVYFTCAGAGEGLVDWLEEVRLSGRGAGR